MIPLYIPKLNYSRMQLPRSFDLLPCISALELTHFGTLGKAVKERDEVFSAAEAYLPETRQMRVMDDCYCKGPVVQRAM
jgi:hypothetical protein